TADRSRATSLTGIVSGKASTTLPDSVHRPTSASSISGNSRRATVVLPQPDGPTMRPMCHGLPSSGKFTFHDRRLVFSAGKSKSPRTCCTRGVSTIGVSTVMCMDSSLLSRKRRRCSRHLRGTAQTFLLKTAQQLDLLRLVGAFDDDEKLLWR